MTTSSRSRALAHRGLGATGAYHVSSRSVSALGQIVYPQQLVEDAVGASPRLVVFVVDGGARGRELTLGVGCFACDRIADRSGDHRRAPADRRLGLLLDDWLDDGSSLFAELFDGADHAYDLLFARHTTLDIGAER